MKKTKRWLLVADGKQAQAYHYDGPSNLPRADPTFSFAHEDAYSRDILSDKPGRMASGGGAGNNAFTPRTDAHELEETRFLDQIAEQLAVAVETGQCETVILAAPPKALGHLRKKLPATASRAISHQIDKDLTNLPLQKLGKVIGDYLAA